MTIKILSILELLTSWVKRCQRIDADLCFAFIMVNAFALASKAIHLVRLESKLLKKGKSAKHLVDEC